MSASTTQNLKQTLIANSDLDAVGAIMDGGSSGSQAQLDLLNVSYTVTVGGSIVKKLLQNVNLSISGGQLCAVMGLSGSGKSLLLQLCANRLKAGHLSGQVLVNKAERQPWYKYQSAYMHQDDVHIPIFTVLETVRYAAWTRCPESVYTDAAKEARVQFMLETFGLAGVKDSLVGNPMIKGISGGQKRRLSLIVDLINSPDFMFLDEPTTGLDSSIALATCKSLKALLGNNKIGLVTIHQPSPDVFAVFDRVILMNSGRVVYSGPTNQALAHFSEICYPPKQGVNPAEFIIQVCTKGAFDAATLQKKFEGGSPHYQSPVSKGSIKTSSVPPSTSSQWTQFKMLCHRGFWSGVRDWAALKSEVIKHIFLGLLVGITFFGDGNTSSTDAAHYFNNLGAPTSFLTNVDGSFFFIFILLWYGEMQAIPGLCQLNQQYRRELSAAAYVPGSFWASTILVNVPKAILLHTIFFVEYYLLAGFQHTTFSGEIFGVLWIALLFGKLLAFYAGMFFATWTADPVVTYAVVPPLFLFMGAYTGWSETLPSMPKALSSWLPLFSVFRWVYEIIMIEVFNQPNQTPAVNDFTGFNSKNDQLVSFIALVLYVIVILGLIRWAVDYLPSLLQITEDDEGVPMAIRESMVSINDPKGVADAPRPQSGKNLRESTPSMTKTRLGAMEDGEGTVNPLTETDASDEFRPLTESFGVKGVSSFNRGSNLRKSEMLEIEADENRSFGSAQIPASSSFGRGSVLRNQRPGVFAAADRGSIIQRMSSFVTGAPSQLAIHEPAVGVTLGLDDYERKSTAAGVKPVSGLTLDILEINYKVKNPASETGAELHLLNNITSTFKPGTMTALMGASGAGKSTLLDVIADRKTVGSITGTILFDGKARDESINSKIAYVQQDDFHLPMFTVKETVMYSCLMRLQVKDTQSESENEQRVQQVVHLLGLDDCADSLVGNHLIPGITGGKKRRLSIAVEIVSLPLLIFMDEPTSGLDSFTSNEVVASIRNLTNQGRTLICTIHQPSADAFAMFDNLVLMAKGRMIYSGSAAGAAKYFLASPFSIAATKINPADHVIAVAGGNCKLGNTDEIVVPEKLMEYWASTSEAKRIHDVIVAKAQSNMGRPQTQIEKSQQPYATSAFAQFRILTRRYATKFLRTRRPINISLARCVLVALLFGFTFMSMSGGSGYEAYKVRLSFCFFSVFFNCIVQMQTIPPFFEDRLLYFRERGARIYHPIIFWIATWVVYCVFLLVHVLLYCLIAYNMSGMEHNIEKFLTFYVSVFFAAFTAFFCCQTIAAMSPTPQAAMGLYPNVVFTNFLFAGFFQFIPEMRTWLSPWLPSLSWIRWSYQAVVNNELSNNPMLSEIATYQTRFGYENQGAGASIGILIVFTLLYLAALVLALTCVNHEKR